MVEIITSAVNGAGCTVKNIISVSLFFYYEKILFIFYQKAYVYVPTLYLY